MPTKTQKNGNGGIKRDENGKWVKAPRRRILRAVAIGRIMARDIQRGGQADAQGTNRTIPDLWQGGSMDCLTMVRYRCGCMSALVTLRASRRGPVVRNHGTGRRKVPDDIRLRWTEWTMLDWQTKSIQYLPTWL